MMTRIALTAALMATLATSAMAQSASTEAGVGPGTANGSGTYSGPFGFAQSESRVGDINMGRGLAVGFGPNGLSLSHSIAVGKGPLSVGHNLNMTVGRNGTHVSDGGVISTGGPTSVNVGGSTQAGRHLGGGSTVTGNGRKTNAWSNSRTRNFRQPQIYPVTTAVPNRMRQNQPVNFRSFPIRFNR